MFKFLLNFIEKLFHKKQYTKPKVLWKRKEEIHIEKYYYDRFYAQLRKRERIYGTPLPYIQKEKAARAIRHEIYPTPQNGGKYGGEKGHWLRQRVTKTLLNDIGINYIMK